MSNGNGHRWSKFWWQDWQNDKALQSCSMAARGLWIELLGIAHGSERVGYVLVNGQPPDTEQLADMLGKVTAKEIARLLAELERLRIFSRDDDGIIYSRRMVKDAAASEAGRENVTKRWTGNGKSPHPNRVPNTPPIRGATRDPMATPTSPPNTLEAKSTEAEEERGSLRSQRARACASRPLPTDWNPSIVAKNLAEDHGFDNARLALEADQMRAWAWAKNCQLPDWDWRFNAWINKAAHRDKNRNQPAKSVHQQIREDAGLGTFLTNQPYEETVPNEPRLMAITGGRI